MLTEIIYTFNCYINNLAFSKPSKREKKEIRVENKRTLAVRFSKIVVLRSFLNLSKFFPFLIQSSKTFHIFGAVAADDYPLYSSILYNRRYLSLIFPASCSADVTTAVTHDGDAGMKASAKKVAERQRES